MTGKAIDMFHAKTIKTDLKHDKVVIIQVQTAI